ncbi:ABC transporter permease [Ramlibacter henchirensis]|uniref:Transport permease protein n=1 Tax=Ramlibacter henchirensis TaxID=204072 RepID=A0A4Z0C0V7_9BURK|nr:ABC transporter permease [Ramlibacter henchirensis]TFZ05166.1 ABC transporter permease [Ramlibacter henchirensis]
MGIVRALWAYRGFVAGSVRREFQAKYRNSLLGAAWTVLNPLSMIVVYTVIFAQVMRARVPGLDSTFAYSIYLCSGILTWGLFAEITSRSQNMFLEHANLIKKLSFPRLCLPVVVLLNALINFGIVFGLFCLFLLITGNFPGPAFLAVVPLLLLQVAFGIGLGVTLGVLNVFFRDVGQFFGILLQFWFWLTPIVYPVEALPEGAKWLISLNPLTSVITGYQRIFTQGLWPHWGQLLPTAVLAVLLCMLGLRLFRRNSGEMVDEL